MFKYFFGGFIVAKVLGGKSYEEEPPVIITSGGGMGEIKLIKNPNYKGDYKYVSGPDCSYITKKGGCGL